jgi:hypothetical protein
MTPNHRLVSWLLVASLTAALTAVTTVQALRRYHELRTGWSWDLAYPAFLTHIIRSDPNGQSWVSEE